MSAIEIAKLQKERKVFENSIIQLNIFHATFRKNLVEPIFAQFNQYLFAAATETLRTFISLILAIIDSIFGCATEKKLWPFFKTLAKGKKELGKNDS